MAYNNSEIYEERIMRIKKNILLTIKKTADPNFVNKSVVFFLVTLFVISSVSALNITSQDTRFFPLKVPRNEGWNVTINFNETSGKNDYIIFGEAPDASDGVDSYDAPNPPSGPDPFLDAYFTANFSWPYNKMFKEIKYYPDNYKIWNFTVWWTDFDTTVTMSWNITKVDESEYDSVILCDSFGNPLTDMLSYNNYVFFYSSGNMEYFQIVAHTVNHPIQSDPHPSDGSVGIERPPDELNITVEDPDGDIMDIYIRWKRHGFYHFGEWVTLKTYSDVGNGIYNFIVPVEHNWTWGNTTYTWSVNITDGSLWTNETYQYTTSGSRYDVNNDNTVNFQDAGLVWVHRTSEEPYDGIYDVNQNGQVNFQDAGLTWINRY